MRDHLAALRSRPKRPVHLETRRDVDERRLETLRVVVKKPCHHPHEEGVGFRIVELLGLQNTRASRKKRRAYGGNYSRTRSEERRVGKEGGGPWRTRGAPD